MLRKLSRRLSYANVMATVAVFIALGGSAYAVNTVRSSDIVDNEVYSADVRNDNLSGGGLASGDIQDGAMTTNEIKDDNQPFGGLFAQDLAAGSVGSSEVADNSLSNTDVIEESLLFNNTLNANDIGAGAVGSSEVANDSLTGSDINESTLVGVKDGCHSGAALLGRLCAVAGGSNATVYEALNTCSPIGMRLPTWSEAITLAANHDVPGVGAPPERFWTEEVTTAENAGGPFHAMVVDENGIGTDNADFAANKIVCVETPNNL